MTCQSNTTVTVALVDAGKAIDDRSRLYEDAQTGLKSRFQQAKAAAAMFIIRGWLRI